MNIDLIEMVRKHSLVINQVVHVGAHFLEEQREYDELNLGRVYWIEANPEIYATIKQRETNRHVIMNYLVSDTENDPSVLHVSNNTFSSSMLNLGIHSTIFPEVHFTHDILLNTKTLLSIVNEHEIALAEGTLLNVDVQGVELQILKGLGDRLGNVTYILAEVNFVEMYQGNALIDEIDSYVDAFGFQRKDTFVHESQCYGLALYAKQPTIFVLYDSTICDDFYPGDSKDNFTFVKMGKSDFVCEAHRSLNPACFSTFLDLGYQYAEYEFYLNLYNAHLSGEFELPDFLGIIHYDMEPTGAIEFLEALPKDHKTVVFFQSHSIRELMEVGLFDETLIRKGIRYFNSKYSSNKEFDCVIEKRTVTSGAFWCHRDLFVRLMEFLVPLYSEVIWHDPSVRFEGLALERYVALFFALSDVTPVEFSLKHHFRRSQTSPLFDPNEFHKLCLRSWKHEYYSASERVPLDLIRKIRSQFGLRMAVETGAAFGDSALMLSELFEIVHTIEIDEEACRFARHQAKIRCKEGIHVHHANSQDILAKILKDTDNVFIWLDAHVSDPIGNNQKESPLDECPLMTEIRLIVESGLQNFVIGIDDLRMFKNAAPPPHKSEQWPSLLEIQSLIQSPDRCWVEYGDALFNFPVLTNG